MHPHPQQTMMLRVLQLWKCPVRAAQCPSRSIAECRVEMLAVVLLHQG